MSNQSNWRGLAERASKEQDSEKLMAIVEELTGSVAACNGSPATQKLESLIGPRQELNRAELH